MQVRLALSAIDRELDLNQKLMVARRADESMTQVVLRVLAYCLFQRPDISDTLQFTVGPADRDCPDLWAHNLIGQPIEWIVCGQPDADELRHVLQHQRQAAVRVLFGSDVDREQFFHQVRSLRRRVPGIETVDFRQVSADLIEHLARHEWDRQRWAVTFVEDHVYIDADGVAVDSEILRPKFVEAESST
jgi:uncharacterized protein YaeQ